VNWEAIGAVGELVGSLAVLVTIIYLAVQVKHARRQMQIASQRQRYETFRNLTLEISRNPELRRIYAKLREGYSDDVGSISELFEICDLPVEDYLAFNGQQQAMWMYRQETIEFIEELTPSQRADFDIGIRRMMGSGPGYLWYKNWREMAARDDVVTPGMDYIDSLLEKDRLTNILADKSFLSSDAARKSGGGT